MIHQKYPIRNTIYNKIYWQIVFIVYNKSKDTKMETKKQLRQNIQLYRAQIDQYASGPNNIRRLNNLYWVRYRITAIEPKILFQASADQTKIDYTYMHNIGDVYDYINQFQDRPTQHQLSIEDVQHMHKLFTAHTHMEWVGGTYRRDDKVLNIIVNGSRMHAIDAQMVPYTMNEIIHQANTSKASILNRAYDLHYEIIALQPFEDCNKRLARAAMNLFLVLNKMPMIFFDNREDKLGYINAFAARANGQNKVYTEYMLHATERSYRGILKNIKNSKIR